jgi:hypothetical protein
MKIQNIYGEEMYRKPFNTNDNNQLQFEQVIIRLEILEEMVRALLDKTGSKPAVKNE